MRCKHCGSELHWPAECPPRERAVRTAEVTIGGVTTQYVLKEDYDQTVQDAQTALRTADIREKGLQMELARMRQESDWQWFQDHIKALQARYEAELNLYRFPACYITNTPDVPFVPVSSLHYKCDCGAVCSSRENLVSHVQYEAIHSKGFKVRERHVKFAAAIDTLYPPCKSRCADCP